MPQDRSPDETVFASVEDPDWLPPEINTGVAHSARVYNYLLGGKDNFKADREVGDGLIAAIPSAPLQARENRAFLGRAVRYLAGQAGIRQFLDIGTGIPAAGNTHEVAQAAAPDSRIVYVDNDPIVLAHARALMTSDPAGASVFIQADFREPGKALERQADFGVGADRRRGIYGDNCDHLARIVGIETEGRTLADLDAIECNPCARL